MNVVKGDSLYFRAKAGISAGKVVCHGKDGVTLECDGKRHQVPWDQVLGHQARVHQAVDLVSQGEDGAVVSDERGGHHYIEGFQAEPDEDEGDEGDDVTKSIFGLPADKRAVILVKAGPIANRPGLTQQEVTDKRGLTEKRWVRTNKDEGGGERQRQADPERERGSQHGYGTHNLQPGDYVHYSVDGDRGHGRITHAGRDGAHIEDHEGNSRPVRWGEVTGHAPRSGGGDGGDEPPPSRETRVLGSQEPIDAANFKASAYYADHDDAEITPEKVLEDFPEDTADKIRGVVDRLKSIEETLNTYKHDGKYDAERLKVHQAIYDKILSKEAVASATPAKGEKPTFLVLGGRGGSGKSWFKGQVYDPSKFIVLDNDAIKELLGEHGKEPTYEGWNAFQFHEEASDVFDTLTDLAESMGLNIVHDATMKTKSKAVNLIKRFQGNGYRTEAHYMHLPRFEAARRAVERFLGSTQRYVPAKVILSNSGNEESFDAVRELVDKWSFRDNNVPKGSDPILISEGENGRESEERDDETADRGLGGSGSREVRDGLQAGATGNGQRPVGSSQEDDRGTQERPIKKALDFLRSIFSPASPSQPLDQGGPKRQVIIVRRP